MRWSKLSACYAAFLGGMLTASAQVSAPGALLRTIDAAPYRGQSFRVRASVRLDRPALEDRAQLFVRVVRPGSEPGFYDDMGDRPVVSAAAQPCEIEGDIAPDAASIEIGLKVTGKSRAFVDGLSFEAAPSAVDPAVRAALVRIYARLDAAYAASDAATLASVAEPEAAVVIAGQSTPLSAILAQVAAEMRTGTHYESHSTVTAIRVDSPAATVWVNNRTAFGSQLAASASRDTWRLAGADWKLERSVLIATYLDNSAPVIAELRQRAAAIDSLGAAAAGARIVALGEASYGTHEFAELNIRAIRDLVEHHGFTVVAIGANWAETRAVDQWIRTGQGDPSAAIEALNAWPWETAELLELVRWMREWNAAPGHAPLHLAGFDAQPSPAADRVVLAYLKEYSPEDEGPAQLAYSEVRDAERAAAAAAGVARLLDVKHRELVDASSVELWRDARQAAAVAWQSRRGAAHRSEALAANVVWLAAEAYPSARIVLWTHNANVSAAPEAMGALLRRRYGAQFYSVGYVFRGGEVRAVQKNDVAVHTVAPASEGSGDAVLAAAGIPEFFLDLRRLPSNTPLARWLAQPHEFHQVGVLWDDRLVPLAPAALYDGLVFVETSTPTRELP